MNHLLHGERNKLQAIEMVSDLLAAMILAACCAASII
jgi:hypothetical protein